MPKTLLPEHLQKAIEANVDLIDVLQGEIKNLMYEWDNKSFNDTSYSAGYKDCLTDLYTLCYDVIFYQSDVEHTK